MVLCTKFQKKLFLVHASSMNSNRKLYCLEVLQGLLFEIVIILKIADIVCCKIFIYISMISSPAVPACFNFAVPT